MPSRGKWPPFVFFVVFFVVFLGAKTVWAASGTGLVDIPVGIAIPSNNSAILQNPAALAKFQNKVFDLSTLLGSGGFPDVTGSFSSGAGSYGFGIEVQRVSNNFVATTAFAASTGKFSIGVAATTGFSPFAPTFTLGLRHELKAYSIAFVTRDLSNITGAWALGLGIPAGSSLRFGVDFNFTNNSQSFGISGAGIVASGEIYATQKYSFQMMYGLAIIPNLSASSPGLGAGVSFWLGKKTAIYGLYHEQAHEFVIGLKFLL